MSFNITANKLTGREYDIMSILWQSEKPLIASEIVRLGSNLTINTVQAVLKKLMSKDLIEVDQIVYSGTVLTRSYKPTVSSDDFEINHLLATFQKLSSKPDITSNFVSALLEQEKDTDKLERELDQLEAVLQEKRQLLAKKSTHKKE